MRLLWLMFTTALLVACPTGPEASDAGPIDATHDAAATGDAAVGPLASCAEASLTECFSNLDCPTAERCLDVGAAGDDVPCCVPGPRGTLEAGEVCDPATGEADCASSICIDSNGAALCSTICETAATCPTNMPRCIPIMFSDSTDSWCFPS